MSRKALVLSCLLAVGLTGCGGGGDGGVATVDWYYHWDCHGDYDCLSTVANGQPSGTSYQGPDVGGQAGCNNLLQFGNNFWNIPPAVQWCDNTITFDPPSVTISVAPNPINEGSSATVTWSSHRVSSCTASGAWTGSKATSGTEVVTPLQGTRQYAIRCTGSVGTVSATATLTVNAHPPGIELALDQTSINLGESATLTWKVYQYTSCSASGPWSGSRPLSGSELTTPAAKGSFSYTLSCLSPTLGSASASVTLVVGPSPPAAPTLDFGASIEFPSCIDTGMADTLSWTTTGVTACTASGAWSGDRDANGSEQVYPGASSPSAYSTHDYTLNCSGPGGSVGKTVTICATPTSGAPPPPVTVSISVTPGNISLGETTRLSWSSQYASSCTGSNAWTGQKTLNGSLLLTPDHTGSYLYYLQCQNYSSSASAYTELSVQSAAGNDPLAARFNLPHGVWMSAANDLYIVDANNHAVRVVTNAGQVRYVAGLEGATGSADGTGASARFYYPWGVGGDNAGNLYVADYNNYTVRRIAPGDVVTTLAGAPGNIGDGVNVDGTGSAASIYRPVAPRVGPDGNIYVGDGYGTVRRITTGGEVTTFAGLNRQYGYVDATGTSARFHSPYGMAFAGTDLYVVDAGNNAIRKIDAGGTVTTFAGNGSQGAADGTGTAATFKTPWGIVRDSQGNFFVTDYGNYKIRKITPAGVVTTFAGSGAFGYDNLTGTAATFGNISDIAIDSSDNLYVADSCSIRKITPAAVVSTYAGADTVCGSGN